MEIVLILIYSNIVVTFSLLNSLLPKHTGAPHLADSNSLKAKNKIEEVPGNFNVVATEGIQEQAWNLVAPRVLML